MKTKKQNTTRGRGTPGSRSNGSEISRAWCDDKTKVARNNEPDIYKQHSKDVENMKKSHKTFMPAAPKPGLVGEEPTADPIPKASTSRRKPKISKSSATAQKSLNNALEPSRAWCDDKTKLKMHQKKPGVKKGSGAKWVRVTSPT